MMQRKDLELHLQIDDAVRWEAALADLDRLTAGINPRPLDLAAAPILTDWQRDLVPTLEPALIGRVEGHPRLPGRRRIATSRLIALDLGRGYARTLSRWYRLSDPAR